jgi:WD40 repeat protein
MGAPDSTVRIWSLETAVAEFVLENHERDMVALACGEYDGTQVLFTGGAEGVIQAWDLTRERRCLILNFLVG